MLLKLAVFQLVSQPSAWLLSENRETGPQHRAWTVFAWPINQKNLVRFFEEPIDAVHIA
jgi:hypothetical protein